jgi:LemA protein
MADVRIGEAEVAMPALRARNDELGLDELGHVRARGLGRHAGGRGELAGGQVLSAHQRRQHAGARGVADHRGDSSRSAVRARSSGVSFGHGAHAKIRRLDAAGGQEHKRGRGDERVGRKGGAWRRGGIDGTDDRRRAGRDASSRVEASGRCRRVAAHEFRANRRLGRRVSPRVLGRGGLQPLVSLRNDISRAFTPVDEQIRRRRALLDQWIEALRPAMHDAAVLDAVTAASGQLQTACDVVRGRPSAARPMAILRLAEETLAEARLRVKSELPSRPEQLQRLGLAELAEELAAADSTLGFARRQFNDATQHYNEALDQFPTWVIAGLFGFRGAGTL